MAAAIASATQQIMSHIHAVQPHDQAMQDMVREMVSLLPHALHDSTCDLGLVQCLSVLHWPTSTLGRKFRTCITCCMLTLTST